MRDKIAKMMCPPGLTLDEFEKLAFYRTVGIRLTYQGCMRFKKFTDHYMFELNRKTLTAGDYLHLQREMKYPYYIGSEKTVVFSKQDAFLFKLHGGIREWLDSMR